MKLNIYMKYLLIFEVFEGIWDLQISSNLSSVYHVLCKQSNNLL